MRHSLTALALVLPSAALAEPLEIVADIPPIAALVAEVAGERSEVTTILPPGVSPHSHALTPSEARRISDADVIVWVGPELTPWLSQPLDNIAGGERLTLLSLIEPYDVSSEGHDEAHHDDHAHEDHGHDHAHDHDHAEEAHADDHGHDHDHAEDHHAEDHGSDHQEAEAGHGGHAHGSVDPHAWLDPSVAIEWVPAIADALAEADPEGAETYRQNAEQTVADLRALRSDLESRLADVPDDSFVVAHDAFGYFERAFGLSHVGAISDHDDALPSPSRLDDLRSQIAQTGATCILSQPLASTGLADAVWQGTPYRQVVIDPLGADISVGQGQYAQLLEGLADAVVECTQAPSAG